MRSPAEAAAGNARMWRRRAHLAQVLILAVLITGVVYVADRIGSLASVNPDAERALQGRHQARNFH